MYDPLCTCEHTLVSLREKGFSYTLERQRKFKMIYLFGSIVLHLNVIIIKGHDQEKWNCEHTISAESPSVSRPVQWSTDCRPDLSSFISIHTVSTFSAGLSGGVRVLSSRPPPPILSFCP